MPSMPKPVETMSNFYTNEQLTKMTEQIQELKDEIQIPTVYFLGSNQRIIEYKKD